MVMRKTLAVSGPRGRYLRERRKIISLGRKLSGFPKTKKIGIEIYLLADREMRNLNRKFLGKDRPTNVLSFSAGPGFINPNFEKDARYLGEIFLAPDYIRARGEDLEVLFVHGLAHLLGYTHDGKSDKMRMEKMERRLIKTLNV